MNRGYPCFTETPLSIHRQVDTLTGVSLFVGDHNFYLSVFAAVCLNSSATKLNVTEPLGLFLILASLRLLAHPEALTNANASRFKSSNFFLFLFTPLSQAVSLSE